METYNGHVRTPADAIILFEACRIGLLPRVQRRLSEKERQSIKSGSVFVWDEREAGMRRWTDGKSWSASRVSGSFLTYREMEGKRGGNNFDKTASANRDGIQGNDADSDGSPDGYRYKVDGLMKQSFSITTNNGQHLHLISYFSRSAATAQGLMQPTNDPQLRHIRPEKGMYPESTVHEQSNIPAVTRGPMNSPGYSHNQHPPNPYGRMPYGYPPQWAPPSPMHTPPPHPNYGPYGYHPGYPPYPGQHPMHHMQPPPHPAAYGHPSMNPYERPHPMGPQAFPPPQYGQPSGQNGYQTGYSQPYPSHYQSYQPPPLHNPSQAPAYNPPQSARNQQSPQNAQQQQPSQSLPPPPQHQSQQTQPQQQATTQSQAHPQAQDAASVRKDSERHDSHQSNPEQIPTQSQPQDQKSDTQAQAGAQPPSTPAPLSSSGTTIPSISAMLNGGAQDPPPRPSSKSPNGSLRPLQDIPSHKLGFEANRDMQALRNLDKSTFKGY
ncbi:hypothetical protein MBLNU230_g8100t1 [Neophaeotheca triangularis]